MKYTKDEAFDEVMRRSRVLKQKHARKTAALLSLSACAVMAAMLLVIGRFGRSGTGMSSQSAYGSFLLPTEAGGYILAAVIAFAVGVGVTLCIQKYRKSHKK